MAADSNQQRGLKPEFSPPNDLKNRIACIREDIRWLVAPENGCVNKDDLISSLHEEVVALEAQLKLADARSRDPFERVRDGHETVTALDPSLWRTPRQQQHIRMPQANRLPPDDAYTSSHGFVPVAQSNQPLYSRESVPPPLGCGIPSPDVSGSWSELERLRKDRAAASDAVSQLQKELAARDAVVRSLSGEIERLKNELAEKDNSVASLRQENEKMKSDIPEKDSYVNSLVANTEALKNVIAQKDAELAAIKDTNTELTKKTTSVMDVKDRELLLLNHRHKMAEARVEELNELVTSLKEELARSRDSDIQQQERNRKLAKELEDIKELEKSERTKITSLQDLSTRLEKLRNQVVQLAFQGSDTWENSSQISDDGLVSTLRVYLFERLDLQKKVKDIEAQVGERDKTIKGAKKFKQQINEIIMRLEEKTTTSEQLKLEIANANELSFVGNEISCALHELTIKILSLLLTWQQQLESLLQRSSVDMSSEKDCLKAVELHISELRGKWNAANKVTSDWELRYEAAKVQHQVDLNAALNNLRQRLEVAHHEELHKKKQEADAKLKQAVSEKSASERAVRESAISSLSDKLATLQEKADSLTITIKEREDNIDCLKTESQLLSEQLRLQETAKLQLVAKIENLEKMKRDAVGQLEAQLADLQARSSRQSVEQEGQLRKHSETICTLEEQLNKTVKINKEHQTEIASLKASNTDLNERLQQPPKPKLIVQKPAVDVAALQRTVSELEHAKSNYVQQISQLNDVITSLRREVAASQAKLSDVTGEMSEKQKQEMEKSRTKIRELEKELNETRLKMASLSEIVDQHKDTITKLRSDISTYEASIKRYNEKINESAAKNLQLEQALASAKNSSEEKSECVIIEEERAKSELVSLGAQCKGDRHDQVILRQREALVELRTRIRQMEKLAAGFTQTPDQALQQVLLLQSQYCQLEENEMASSVAANGSNLSHVDQAVNNARGLRSRMDIDIQLGILRESQLALELSETTYLALLRAVTTALEVTEVEGHQSMAHASGTDRDHLVEVRAASSNLLVERIRMLKDVIVHKDDLLLGYQQSLAKLSETQQFAEDSSLKAETLNMEMRKLSEEAHCLRELLARNREELERERRLNEAIKQKKTYHLENELIHKNGWPKHNCLLNDPSEKVVKKKVVHARGKSVDVRIQSSDLKLDRKSDDQVRFTIVSADG